MFKFIVIFCLSFASFAQGLTQFKATYDLSIDGLTIAQEKRQLSQYKQGYLFIAQAKTTGLAAFFKPYSIKTSSYFIIDNKQIKTKRYQLLKKAGDKIKDKIDLYVNNNQVVNQVNNTTYTLDALLPIIDKLNLFTALPYAINNNPNLSSITYQVIKKEAASLYHFINHGLQTKQLEGEKMRLIKLTRNHPKRPLEVWLDPNNHYLPIIIQQIEKGKTYRYTLTDYSPF